MQSAGAPVGRLHDLGPGGSSGRAKRPCPRTLVTPHTKTTTAAVVKCHPIMASACFFFFSFFFFFF